MLPILFIYKHIMNGGNLLKKLFLTYILIIIIMIVSAELAQMTPKAIGWLTDDILTKNEISFNKVIPFLVFIFLIYIIRDII